MGGWDGAGLPPVHCSAQPSSLSPMAPSNECLWRAGKSPMFLSLFFSLLSMLQSLPCFHAFRALLSHVPYGSHCGTKLQ